MCSVLNTVETFLKLKLIALQFAGSEDDVAFVENLLY